jgi:hypothetical protein
VAVVTSPETRTEEVIVMDPVSLIVAALAAGASAALKDTAGQAVRDAYVGLKALVKRRVAEKPLAQEVIDKHGEAPEVWEKPLREELAAADVADDEELVRAAQKVLAIVDPSGAQAGKYNVTIAGGKGVVVGDHAQVHMTFEDGD